MLPLDDLKEVLALANDRETVHVAMRGFKFGETCINRNSVDAIQVFHAGWSKSGIGGTDGKHGLFEYLGKRCVYLQGST